MALPDLKFDGPYEQPCQIVLTHGAGQPMDSPFMTAFAEGLAAQGLRVCRFEFPYMAARRKDGTKRPPDSQGVLLQTWRDVVRALGGPKRLVIGGKSMGGRMASMVAEELGVRGLVCLGYPFHATGRPDAVRIAHLTSIKTPTLIVQGTRDNMGSQDDVKGYDLGANVAIHWMADGDHSFKPTKASGRSERQAWEEGIATVAAFVAKLEAAQPKPPPKAAAKPSIKIE